MKKNTYLFIMMLRNSANFLSVPSRKLNNAWVDSNNKGIHTCHLSLITCHL